MSFLSAFLVIDPPIHVIVGIVAVLVLVIDWRANGHQ